MSEINEHEQIPHKFYNRLDVPEKASNLKVLIPSASALVFVTRDECIENLAQLARNIKLIISEYPENYVKRCRDINYWFKEKIKTCKDKTGEDMSPDSTTVFNDIKWFRGGKKIIVCPKKLEPDRIKHVDLKKDLDDYCEIRDSVRCNIFKDSMECLKHNTYIKKKKQYFSSKMKGICSGPQCSWDDYTIDDNCTLNNMDNTFREINCEELYKKEVLQEPVPATKERSPLEIGFFIIVSFILFYLFILFLEKFTPVVSIIHRFKRRKYDLKRNIERENHDSYSPYHSDTMPADSENKRYYIEYGRPQN
ncbi:hypothetical protein PVPAM_130009500 [Plasmodium vivax]|nr:hypothetical protein PVPAM_130009500 [Plasmodium vivax]